MGEGGDGGEAGVKQPRTGIGEAGNGGEQRPEGGATVPGGGLHLEIGWFLAFPMPVSNHCSVMIGRTPTAAGGLLPAGTISTATRTTFDQPPIWFCPNEKKSSRTSTPFALYYSIFGWINNQQAPFWPRVIETNSGKNLVFDPGGSTDVFSPARFWERGARCFVGKFFVSALDEAAAFLGGRMTRESTCCTYSGRSLFLRSQAVLKKLSCRQRWHEAI